MFAAMVFGKDTIERKLFLHNFLDNQMPIKMNLKSCIHKQLEGSFCLIRLDSSEACVEIYNEAGFASPRNI